MPSRHEQIGAYYADNADRVERTVASHVNANGTGTGSLTVQAGDNISQPDPVNGIRMGIGALTPGAASFTGGRVRSWVARRGGFGPIAGSGGG